MEDTNRSVRYLARFALNRVSTVKGCRDCGRVSIVGNVVAGGPDLFTEPTKPSAGAVGVRAMDVDGKTVAGYAGLATCGRIWLCPVCNAKVMARRSLEIGLVLAWAHANGLRVVWGSLTAWHTRTDRLVDLLDIQRAAWRSVVNSKTWRSWGRGDRSSSRVGYIRAAEITYGDNGWHPHFHPIILVEGSRADAQVVAQWMQRAWVQGVRAAGGSAEAEGGAQRLEVLEPGEADEKLAAYVTKATYAATSNLPLEAVWSQSKTGRGRVKGTAAHWALLEGITQGLADDVARWWELEDATNGHRMITWSRDLRKLAGVGEEVQDEVLAAEEVGNVRDTVCYITPKGWRSVRERPALQGMILDVLEQGGWLGLRDFLDANDVEWVGADGDGLWPSLGEHVPLKERKPSGIVYIDPELMPSLLKLT